MSEPETPPDGWTVYTLEDFEDVVDAGKMPVLVQTERRIAVFAVEPGDKSELQSDDDETRITAMVRATFTCGIALDRANDIR